MATLEIPESVPTEIVVYENGKYSTQYESLDIPEKDDHVILGDGTTVRVIRRIFDVDTPDFVQLITETIEEN